MTTTLEHNEGQVLVTAQADGRNLVKVSLHDAKTFSPRTECVTSYTVELINLILKVKGAAWLCDEIARDEDPNYVRKYLENELRAYFQLENFNNKRILDFGSGSGASTMWLSRLFPQSEIVGVELESELLSVAQARLKHYGFKYVSFLQSPNGLEIPKGLQQFDLIVMSAVYEHLLPNERQIIMSQLWSLVCNNGFLFLNQTPNRLFPIELHTTMLPLINYLPDTLALAAARKFSRRVESSESWKSLLRKGIRGATVREIKKRLVDGETKAIMLEPKKSGLRDPVDLWFLTTNSTNLVVLKQTAKVGLKAIFYFTGIAIVPDLALAFQKLLPET
jgi:2-polyprenyl-3-methyl-5-hydroxy-6-metoxy-1,4-benzoquinol methylase